MKIGILGAMEEEITPLLEILKDYKEIKYANNSYYLANFGQHELILAYSKIGKVNSTLSTAMMIEKFGAQVLLFTGVAGALKSLKIGDLLVATKLCQYDLDITAFGHPLGFVPGNEIFIKTDEKLNELAKQVASELGKKLAFGTIATGDEFICDESKKNKIVQVFDAEACEMEGASIGHVCFINGTKFGVLRAISDGADEKSHMDYDKFVPLAAKNSFEVIKRFIEEY